nr:hypothetical protein [Tanacetum cinerariifolium]
MVGIISHTKFASVSNLEKKVKDPTQNLQTDTAKAKEQELYYNKLFYCVILVMKDVEKPCHRGGAIKGHRLNPNNTIGMQEKKKRGTHIHILNIKPTT